MVVHGDREHPLGVVVADDVLVEGLLDLDGTGHFERLGRRALGARLEKLSPVHDRLLSSISSHAPAL